LNLGAPQAPGFYGCRRGITSSKMIGCSQVRLWPAADASGKRALGPLPEAIADVSRQGALGQLLTQLGHWRGSRPTPTCRTARPVAARKRT